MIEDLLESMLPSLTSILQKIVILALTAAGAHVLIRTIDHLLGRLFDFTQFDRTLEKFAHKTIIALLWLLTLGLLLVILGVDVNAVVASFGVGSFIIGFALKDTLNNFAAGVMILFNHPFKVGDEIEVKGFSGKVKTISMSNTKIITEDNVKIMFPNSFVWSNPIKNFTTYTKKR
ncbi:mechanosensitive ion channel family protein [Candidatus Altiarchaeota archaeon]